MAYNQYPGGLGSTVKPTSSVNTVEFSYHGAYQYVPHGIAEFLQAMGWTTTTNCPDTAEMLFQKHGDSDNAMMYMRWYEAVAYEWYRMMTIGGK